MGRRIGSKLLLTYFLVLIIAFFITSIFYTFLSRRYLITDTREQLRVEGKRIANVIGNLPLEARNSNDNIASKIAEGRRVIRAATRLVNANVAIISKDGRLIFKDESISDTNILELMDTLNDIKKQGYVIERVSITNKNLQVRGYVLLYTKVDSIYELTRLMIRTQLLSFAIAGVIALLIGFGFGKSITRPITQLMLKMKSYNTQENVNYPAIRTGDEIEHLDNSFNEMLDRIRQYDKAQIKFLQNTSHELKTPLMSIQGYAEAIKDEVVEGKEAKDSLDIIINQSQRLKKIVEEIVFLTKLENIDEVLKEQNNNIYDCVIHAVKSIKPIANEKNILIQIHSQTNIYSVFDTEKLSRAFINIIGNAVRYAKGKIDITIKENDKNINIEICDDGIGFENGEEKKIFERFYKGNKGNTGLGLAITKAIVEKHKGKIVAKNNKLNGASFIIELPKNSSI